MTAAVESMILPVAGRDGRSFVEVSAAHLNALTGPAGDHLARLGARRGDVLLMVGSQDDAGALRPYAEAATRLGCAYTAADLARFARPNLVQFFQLYEFLAVFGVRPDVVAVIESHGVTPREVFGAATVFATPAAMPELAASGCDSLAWVPLGPLVGVGCSHSDGAHVSEGEWAVDATADGYLATVHLVTGATVVSRFEAAIDRTPCPCGSAAPRISVGQ